jgi:diaminohydroxyphosphoribosylaminopyrimidine deaminase/5-amino-6-(5-phosphoribosylamino)uracil reductase
VRDLDRDLAWELATGGPWPDPAALSGDRAFMALALREARQGVGLSNPNPPVGCVLVKQGRVIGQGVHTRAGGPHGEIRALEDAAGRGEDPAGATAYVTLEPCCYHGRTPPCTDALLRAGVARVVIGARDPNPRVDGGGVAILASGGVAVTENVLWGECARFHAPFFKFIRTGMPWVSLKLAVGSDDAAGLPGERTPVTPREVQDLAHALRRASQALVVGRGTASADDPRLTDRWEPAAPPHRTFWRVVLDSQAVLPDTLRVWGSVQGQPVLRAVVGHPAPRPGVEDLRLPPSEDGSGCSLRHLLHELASRGVDRVLVEGGPALASAFLSQRLVDEYHEFRSEQPAGGPPLALLRPKSWHSQARAAWSGGTWTVWREPFGTSVENGTP